MGNGSQGIGQPEEGRRSREGRERAERAEEGKGGSMGTRGEEVRGVRGLMLGTFPPKQRPDKVPRSR